jgi:hypothetical protein
VTSVVTSGPSAVGKMTVGMKLAPADAAHLIADHFALQRQNQRGV